jgi:hypothetical protein
MSDPIVPVVGMGAFQPAGSDRYPFTIIAIKSDREITLQSDSYKRIDDNGPYTENQIYEYTPNPEGATYVATKRKNGRWVLKGESINGTKFILGERSYYQSPHV